MIFIDKKIKKIDFFNKKVRKNNRMLNKISSIKQDKIDKSITKEYSSFIKIYSHKDYQPYYLEMEIKKSYLD